MSRLPIALAVLGAVTLVVAADLAIGGLPNPYQAPPILALGSGQAAGGAHCSALPSN